MKSVVSQLSYSEIIEGNKKLHAEEAPFYDRIHSEIWSRKEQQRIKKDLRFALSLVDCAKSALDFGSGTGNLTLKLLEAKMQVTAVDLSTEMCFLLCNRCEEAVNLGNLKILNLNIDKKTLDASFDVVAMCSVLHHLPNYSSTLRRLLSLVKPKGVVYITHEPTTFTLNYSGVTRFLHKINCVCEFSVSKMLKQPKFDYSKSDITQIDYLKIKHVLSKCGFKIIKAYLNNPQASKIPLPTKIFIAKLSKPIQLTIIAQKKD